MLRIQSTLIKLLTGETIPDSGKVREASESESGLYRAVRRADVWLIGRFIDPCNTFQTRISPH